MMVSESKARREEFMGWVRHIELSLYVRYLNMKTWKENASYQEVFLISNRLNAVAELLVIFPVLFQTVRLFS